LDRNWGSVRFGDIRVETDADNHVFEVEVILNDLNPAAVRVELYAEGINGGDPVREEMKCARQRPDASGRCVYHAAVHTARPAGDYTARAIPRHSGIAVPLEVAHILWQR
jgi:starch phosphorylase